ncbi:MAG TPA: hypothetical protein VIG06_21795 [Kofleriaceae bacterium]
MTSPQTHTVWIYAAYGAISLTLTIWLARTLFRNGAVFLEDVFAGDPRIAQALNRLLVVGFYLLNLGYACLLLRAPEATSTIAAVEILARKLGFLLISLGIIHFGNLYLFHRIRRRLVTRVGSPAPFSPSL